MAELTANTTTNTLNVNDLNIAIKRPRLAKRIF